MQQHQSGSKCYKDVKINDSKSKLKVAQNGYLAPLSLQPQSVNLFSFAACAAPLQAWRRNTKEAGCCISLSLELFKEHAASRLHANAIVILVFLFAAAALTFCAFRESFFSWERKLSAECRGGFRWALRHFGEEEELRLNRGFINAHILTPAACFWP